ncbi:Coiled-coil domain-containing protein 61 [Bagarius yarrelli]|uniref:Centrosomal protein CCDC61 n=1 Tax=Bagarius yarrelli TaxID=175774 RepID=A0A556VCF3_BAGYA|nr:Coiled-coil domain-containing protein 61 [Bagarius yarrelli]
MGVGTVIQEELKFRGVDFSIKVELQDRLLTVEISDIMTADQWSGEFDPAYVEDLTRKTGNFKQFPIFCSMLESAVAKSCESVTLDLLTYSDLELLRNRKAGVVGRPRAQQQSPALSAKRYLILIYTVEFDRIHYPLPLPYVGKPDPATLLREIRALRAELNATRTQRDHGASDQELRRLRAELAVVREEKDALAEGLERLRSAETGNPSGTRGLREAVRSLEEQLLKERAKSQRSASKRGQEQRQLMAQRLSVSSLWLVDGLLQFSQAGAGPWVRRIFNGRPQGSAVYLEHLQRKVRRDMLTSPSLNERGRSRSREHVSQFIRRGSAGRGRSTSVESRRSRHSSESSMAEFEDLAKPLNSRGRQLAYNGPAVVRGRPLKKKPMCSTPTQRERVIEPGFLFSMAESSVDTGADLSEIDARLQALQEYMRALDTGR